MSDWSAKMTKIEEIARKKDELNTEFKEQTKEALDAKMEHYEEKRDAIITDMKEKLKVIYIVYIYLIYFIYLQMPFSARFIPRKLNERETHWNNKRTSIALPLRKN